jgi:hypothetical protein
MNGLPVAFTSASILATTGCHAATRSSTAGAWPSGMYSPMRTYMSPDTKSSTSHHVILSTVLKSAAMASGPLYTVLTVATTCRHPASCVVKARSNSAATSNRAIECLAASAAMGMM